MDPATKTGASTASANDHVAPSSGRPMAAAAAAAQDSVTTPPSMTASACRTEPSIAAVNSRTSRTERLGGHHEITRGLGGGGKRPARPQPCDALHALGRRRAAAAACGSMPGRGVASTYQRWLCISPSSPARATQSTGCGVPFTSASMAAEAASSIASRPGGERPCSTAFPISLTRLAKPRMSGAEAMA